MDINLLSNIPNNVPIPPPAITPGAVCPRCHQPILSEYYFCPNCGQELKERPLSTSIWAQIELYLFSLIIMPVTCYLVYKRWQGIKYFRSKDPRAKRIGLVSIILLIVSIIAVVWLIWAGIVWAQQYIQVQENNLNSLSGL